ncbi:small ribosomal subunit protein uS17m-like [Babylonia areolata]|uniref:small ribosomal subunit protein uS17m-like n=1 Tax=Babylonia areolata TaxID=304850 RepID=UPI003FD53F80
MSHWGKLVIGQVMKRGAMRQDFVKVRCLKMKLDKNLNKYFNTRKHYWAVDEKLKTKIGDIVLLEQLPEKLTPLVSHNIKEMVFELGAVVDPVTGQRCRATAYIDETERQLEKEQIEEERGQKAAPSASSSS